MTQTRDFLVEKESNMYHLKNEDQYLGPLAKGLKRAHKDKVNLIENFVCYNRHMETLDAIDNILFDDDLYYGSSCIINNIGHYGGLTYKEQKTFEDLLTKAREEIRARMNIFEKDQLTILKGR